MLFIQIGGYFMLNFESFVMKELARRPHQLIKRRGQYPTDSSLHTKNRQSARQRHTPYSFWIFDF
jgi:hypothetical protein